MIYEPKNIKLTEEEREYLEREERYMQEQIAEAKAERLAESRYYSGEDF